MESDKINRDNSKTTTKATSSFCIILLNTLDCCKLLFTSLVLIVNDPAN